MKKVLIGILILLAIAVIISLPRFLKSEKPTIQQAQATVLKPVEITKAKRGEIRSELELSGTIQAESQVSVFPKVAGRLVVLNVDEGDRWKRECLLLLWSMRNSNSRCNRQKRRWKRRKPRIPRQNNSQKCVYTRRLPRQRRSSRRRDRATTGSRPL